MASAALVLEETNPRLTSSASSRLRTDALDDAGAGIAEAGRHGRRHVAWRGRLAGRRRGGGSLFGRRLLGTGSPGRALLPSGFLSSGLLRSRTCRAATG